MDADGSAWLHWQRVATVVHGVFAWVFCVVAERWMWPHVALVWSRRNGNWIWELCLAAAIVGGVAALTGLGLLYGAADWRDALSSVHWWLGLAWPITVLWHVWKWIAAAFSGSGKRWQD